MSFLAIGIGAGIGAGVGYYRSQQEGGSKDDIWKGALIGGAGGLVAGPAGLGLGSGATVGTASAEGATASAAPGMAGAGANAFIAGPPMANGLMTAGTTGGALSAAPAASTGLAGFLTTPLVPGIAGTNPLMLGTAGMSLAMSGAQTGASTPQDIQLSPEGKRLQDKYYSTANANMEKAISGDARDEAFSDISKLRSAEGSRKRVVSRALGSASASVGNQSPDARGTATVGSTAMSALKSEASERMSGLFAPHSTFNNYRKENLVNASRHLRNIYNLEAGTAAFEYDSHLNQYLTNQQLSSQRGAAIGQVASMFGRAQVGQSVLNRMNS